LISRFIHGESWGTVSSNSFKSVAERIRQLETERKNLLLEIDELKKMADSKAKALESEVSMLRDEVRSLRMILGGTELEPETEPKRKPSRK
jgi:uncharacterized protein (UPF0335 family)